MPVQVRPTSATFMKRPRCRQSGKIRFDTHEQALTRAGEIATRWRTFSAYPCRACHGYHLTTVLLG